MISKERREQHMMTDYSSLSPREKEDYKRFGERLRKEDDFKGIMWCIGFFAFMYVVLEIGPLFLR